jgi:rhamnosyltransferase
LIQLLENLGNMVSNNFLSVVVPTLNAGESFSKLLVALSSTQVIIVDSSSQNNTALIATQHGARVEVISKAEFDHGGTRNKAAKLAQGEILVFLTQDALPAHPDFLEQLTKPILEGKVAMTYARQRAVPSASPLERFFREFRFPDQSQIRRLEPNQPLSVRDVAFSNAAAAYRTDIFWELGGFPEGVILGEDVMLVAKALKAGYVVGYCAEATVWHTHNYSIFQQFKRYFDIGACYSRAGDALGGKQAGGEGWRFAKAQFTFLLQNKAYTWLPRAMLELAAKWLGYRFGFLERKLPLWLKKASSLQPAFWQREQDKQNR